MTSSKRSGVIHDTVSVSIWRASLYTAYSWGKRSQESQGGTNLATVGRKADHSAAHLVGPEEDRRSNRQAQGLSRLQVDVQVELVRPLHGEVRRLGPLQNLIHKAGRELAQLGAIGPIGEQTP